MLSNRSLFFYRFTANLMKANDALVPTALEFFSQRLGKIVSHCREKCLNSLGTTETALCKNRNDIMP